MSNTFRVISLPLLALVGIWASGSSGRAEPGAGASVPPTFTRDVAPILYAHCVECHRPGEVAPMSLLTYQEARPWARSIAQRVR
ncbi:MAG: hypothetical protein AB7I13_07880, partial [Vicinamibacterales bacterium]